MVSCDPENTFPTAASPSRTSFTLLLGLLAAAPESAIAPDASMLECRNRKIRDRIDGEDKVDKLEVGEIWLDR